MQAPLCVFMYYTLCVAVVVWVTNNPATQQAVLGPLFTSWRLTCLCCIVWLKVTQTGEPIFPLSSKHRKPYEIALVGASDATAASLLPFSGAQLSAAEIAELCLPDHLAGLPVICCVACPHGHSRKPPLDDVLHAILRKRAEHKLELFARNLRSGWYSAGLEVLHHQRLSSFLKRK